MLKLVSTMMGVLLYDKGIDIKEETKCICK